ncbi:hypothetical protein OIU34_21955 [Pararhizobium sp. BT-229]|uniref:hypothetical protein n=1 Tax=Pararhizobium sp. BT-229 TaxID=2986923 RepID=UPI0021F7A560|nr:hypothetical protein [Pararhizobium sp. BT-229]MCV9964557.1 hypothetical protein [Pararhizobium sp. BT-229]
MFSATALAWCLAGAVITALTFVLEGGLKKVSSGGFVFAAIVTALFSWVIAWMFMTSFSPWLASTYVQVVVVAGFSVGMRGLFGDMRGGSILAYVAGVVGLIVVAILSSAPMFHASSYANLMVPEIKERDATVPLVDQSQARIVTDELAKKRAAEVLASATEEGLGSRVTMGEPWGNKVGNTMYWLIPLEHSGFFKWLSHGTTPGYIAVSQMNEMNTKFVQDKPIKIGVEGWFDDNIYRHLFNNGFKSQIMGEAIFQVDEDWNPYWVVPMYLPQVGIGGDMPVSWSLVNATTGEIQTFTDEAKVPAWVDRLYHQKMVSERFDDWGCWSQGWAACMFSGNEVIESTAGINVTIDASLDIVYYSGTQFQNNKSEGATSGFYTANARTGKITFYRRAGITEEAAKQVMNGAFADFEGYHAADCVLLTLNREAAYFSIIVDGSGSRKAFAIVSQTNRNVYGKGNSVQAALTDFSRSTQRAGRDAAFEPGTDVASLSFEGVVLTLTPVVQNERTSFYLTLNTLPGKIVEVSEEKIGEIVVTKVGDRVRFTTDNAEAGVMFSTAFDNLGFELVEGPVQTQVDSRNAQAVKEREEAALLEGAMGKIRALSPEELRTLREFLRSE